MMPPMSARALTVLGWLAILAAPAGYLALMDDPSQRTSAWAAWPLLGLGAVLLGVAALRARHPATWVSAGLGTGVLVASLWAFFVWARLPEAPRAHTLETIPAVTLPDTLGQPIDLDARCRSGPTLLVVYRGHW